MNWRRGRFLEIQRRWCFQIAHYSCCFTSSFTTLNSRLRRSDRWHLPSPWALRSVQCAATRRAFGRDSCCTPSRTFLEFLAHSDDWFCQTRRKSGNRRAEWTSRARIPSVLSKNLNLKNVVLRTAPLRRDVAALQIPPPRAISHPVTVQT